MPFELTKEQQTRLKTWAAEQDKLVAQRQGKDFAYYGACGGGYTYCFTPTGLGTVVHVKNSITGDEIDLTDFDCW